MITRASRQVAASHGLTLAYVEGDGSCDDEVQLLHQGNPTGIAVQVCNGYAACQMMGDEMWHGPTRASFTAALRDALARYVP